MGIEYFSLSIHLLVTVNKVKGFHLRWGPRGGDTVFFNDIDFSVNLLTALCKFSVDVP